ncbi:MAG: hypothetical protein FWD73_00320 [Polyangiaceae bacterium]|nr:hypothetical protein [Polyangiaceae bacterium]
MSVVSRNDLEVLFVRPSTSAKRAKGAAVSGCKVALAIATIFAVSGCGRSCKKDHPYVPYAVGDAPAGPSAPPAPAAQALPADAGPALAETSTVLPNGTTTYRAGSVAFNAPSGKELALVLALDVDDDGKLDALAVLRPSAGDAKDAKKAAAPSELAFYNGAAADDAPPTILASAPSLPIGAVCTPVLRLERIGPKSAAAELGAACTSASALRGLFVVRLARDPTITFDMIVRDPAFSPRLAIDVDGSDRDHDGIDDVTLRVTIDGGGPPFEPGPKLTAKVAFFDRSAGLSRDPSEPEASLKVIAAQATTRAKGKDVAAVPVLVQQMRALYRAICEEGGAPRFVTARTGAGAIACGASKSLEEAGIAEVRSRVARGDALGAVTAADLAQLAPATKTTAKTNELAQLLEQIAPLTQAKNSRVLATTTTKARAAAAHPAWGSLTFDPGGKLLVRTGSKVVAVDPDSGEEQATDIAPWPSQVLSADGKSRWLEAYHACEGVALRATFAPTDADGDVKDILLPIAPVLGTRCSGARGEAADAVPLAWTARGLEAVVAGVPVLIRPEAPKATILASWLEEPPPLGSARSPNGKLYAVPSREGVLLGGARAMRGRAAEFEPFSALRGCTVSNDGAHVACEMRGKVIIATFDPL